MRDLGCINTLYKINDIRNYRDYRDYRDSTDYASELVTWFKAMRAINDSDILYDRISEQLHIRRLWRVSIISSLYERPY